MSFLPLLVHHYMYTLAVWCTTDSRFRAKANLSRSGKYRKVKTRTTVC